MEKKLTNVEKIEKKNARLEKLVAKEASKLEGLVDVKKLVVVIRAFANNRKEVNTHKIMDEFGISNDNHEFDEQFYSICYIENRLEEIATNNRQMKHAVAADERVAAREAKQAENKRILASVDSPVINEFLADWKRRFVEWAKTAKEYRYDSVERINEIADREVEAKKLDLIVRIREKAGAIEDVGHLYIANDGNINGKVIGEKATVFVETIGAGGYNIQRFHYRVLVK